MATFQFRTNGGEVKGSSVDPTTYVGQADPALDFVVDPPTPDGENVKTPPKIWDLTNVRNATAPEIANFAVAEAADQVTADKQEAQDLIDVSLVYRKTNKAIINAMIREVNILRALHSLPERTLQQAINATKGDIADGTIS